MTTRKPVLRTAPPISESNGIVTIRDRLTLQAGVDVWQFTTRARSSANLTLSGLSRRTDADLEVLNAKGKVVAAARKRGNRVEQLSNVPIEAGVFYVRVLLQRGNATRYVVTMAPSVPPTPTPTPINPIPVPVPTPVRVPVPTPVPVPVPTPVPVSTPSPTPSPAPSPVSTVDRVGNSFELATSLPLSTTPSQLKDAVGESDRTDFLKLQLPRSGRLNLSLTGLSANADVELYDKNRSLITVLNNEGSTTESLSQRLTEIGVPYYLKVESKATAGTNYTLTTSFVPDETTTTASGLKYVDLAIGNGNTPTTGQIVTVNYTGIFEDGTKFDSSRDRDRPYFFKIGQGQVIAGWDEGLSTMKVGGRRQLIIPPNLAYGAKGVPGSIPENATLIFDVELLAIS